MEGEELEAGVVFVRHAVLRNPSTPPHSTWHTRHRHRPSPSPPPPPAVAPWLRQRGELDHPGVGQPLRRLLHDLPPHLARHGAVPMPMVAQRARVPGPGAARRLSAKLASMSRRGGGTAGGAGCCCERSEIVHERRRVESELDQLESAAIDMID